MASNSTGVTRSTATRSAGTGPRSGGAVGSARNGAACQAAWAAARPGHKRHDRRSGAPLPAGQPWHLAGSPARRLSSDLRDHVVGAGPGLGYQTRPFIGLPAEVHRPRPLDESLVVRRQALLRPLGRSVLAVDHAGDDRLPDPRQREEVPDIAFKLVHEQ